MENDNLSRKEREKLRRKEDILASAQKCFARKGYHECTMEDIAREDQCSVGSLYNFFSGKDEIYKEIFAWHGREHKKFFDKFVINEDNPVASIGDYILARLKYGADNKEFVKMFLRNRMNENFINESLWMENIWPTMKAVRGILESLLSLAMVKGLVRKELDVELLVRHIEHTLYRILEDACQCFCPDIIPEMTLEDSRDFVMDIIFNGIRARGESMD